MSVLSKYDPLDEAHARIKEEFGLNEPAVGRDQQSTQAQHPAYTAAPPEQSLPPPATQVAPQETEVETSEQRQQSIIPRTNYHLGLQEQEMRRAEFGEALALGDDERAAEIVGEYRAKGLNGSEVRSEYAAAEDAYRQHEKREQRQSAAPERDSDYEARRAQFLKDRQDAYDLDHGEELDFH